MENNLKYRDEVIFANETLPYQVMAISKRYAIVTRKIDKKEDEGLIRREVNNGDYDTFEEAFEANKNNTVYYLIDFVAETRAPNDRVFNPYNYDSLESINQCVTDLEAETVRLSERNSCKLEIKTIVPSGVLEKSSLNSSNVKKLFYFPLKRILEVAFKIGFYQYTNVPNEIWEQLCNAESIGSFIAKNLKGKFDTIKLK
ncbi:KTSC domain-containing protein [Taibaiella lutea]|uniref:KTSC domain-containing protein n=1 Tax=Taibaiella lutea TaxID=2608001 RepID=A0A5M6CDY3_9BACT|nr:KTSC domain-containing protein [Taibaiella lutea]KAA5532670.1 KTSC domain-containing protein [Taibaiella lutea]